MRLQSITRNLLPSVVLFSLFYTLSVQSPTHDLPSAKDVAPNAAIGGGGDHAVDQTKNHNSGSTKKKPGGPPRNRALRPLRPWHGAVCGETCFPDYQVREVKDKACAHFDKLKKTWGAKLRQKMMSCAPNVPYCNYNFPSSYKGPKGLFGAGDSLFVWPISAGRWREYLGFKGNYRIVIQYDGECKYVGLGRKNIIGQWKRCKEE